MALHNPWVITWDFRRLVSNMSPSNFRFMARLELPKSNENSNHSVQQQLVHGIQQGLRRRSHATDMRLLTLISDLHTSGARWAANISLLWALQSREMPHTVSLPCLMQNGSGPNG